VISATAVACSGSERTRPATFQVIRRKAAQYRARSG
jgi:hypothetical protein